MHYLFILHCVAIMNIKTQSCTLSPWLYSEMYSKRHVWLKKIIGVAIYANAEPTSLVNSEFQSKYWERSIHWMVWIKEWVFFENCINYEPSEIFPLLVIFFHFYPLNNLAKYFHFWGSFSLFFHKSLILLFFWSKLNYDNFFRKKGSFFKVFCGRKT